MAQATVDTNTRRRDFLALTAAAATTVMAARPALASPPDDSALLALEEQIFEQPNWATSLTMTRSLGFTRYGRQS